MSKLRGFKQELNDFVNAMNTKLSQNISGYKNLKAFAKEDVVEIPADVSRALVKALIFTRVIHYYVYEKYKPNIKNVSQILLQILCEDFKDFKEKELELFRSYYEGLFSGDEKEKYFTRSNANNSGKNHLPLLGDEQNIKKWVSLKFNKFKKLSYFSQMVGEIVSSESSSEVRLYKFGKKH